MIDVSGISPTTPPPPNDFKKKIEMGAHQLRQTVDTLAQKLKELNPSSLNDSEYLQTVADTILKIHQLTAGGK